jgi:CheY-like chemotaxis protein/predicted RNA-binding Zn-ribbon protein involved in translation (DUF1610 family)
MEQIMSTTMKFVCPKCKAKLKFDPDKIKTAIVKFKCPSCASALSIRKPSPPKDTSSPPPAGRAESKAAVGENDSGAKLTAQARSSEKETGYAPGRDQGIPSGEGEQKGSIVENKVEGVSAEKSATDPVKRGNTRQFKRIKFNKKVLVNNQIMVEALDISENGLFLHTGRSFEDGAVVDVGIPTQPGNFDLKVQAVVKHNHRGIGMGLQFVDLDEKDVGQLRKLISELDKAAANELEGRKKILLVGGTDTARNINKSKLVLDGFYVMQATTSQEVFKILEEDLPDAMVLEWQETSFNCKGVLATIKQNPQYDTVIRVVLSALTDSLIQKEILDAGAHRYMAKMDTNPAKLSLVLKQLIDERAGTT